jgi:3-hydroxyacyl-[acyl-carrier-protein] dehydratase
MLHGFFFTIRSIQKDETAAKLVIELNASHEIFKGHFPGRPIVPGACLLQMVKEMMEIILGCNLQLIRANQLKFLSPVDPVKQNILHAELTHTIDEKNGLIVSAIIWNDTVVCFKCSAIFKMADSMYKV